MNKRLLLQRVILAWIAPQTTNLRLRRATIRLHWTDGVVAHLVQVGFDRRYGARPLQRTIERLVIPPLSRYLLANPGLGNATVRLELGVANDVVISNL